VFVDQCGELDGAGERQAALDVLGAPDLAGADVAQQFAKQLGRRRMRVDDQHALHDRSDALMRSGIHAQDHGDLQMAI
jgi:hypothetical protein